MLDVTPYMLVEAYKSVYDQEPVNDDYEILAGYLFDEGLAESYDDVDSIIEELDDEELEGILDEVWGRGKIDAYTGTFMRSNPGGQEAGKSAMRRTPVEKMDMKRSRTQALSPTERNKWRISKLNTAIRHASDNKAGQWTFMDRYNKAKNESFDSYDLVLDYLLDEGYADTEAGALTIMSNMSDEWVDAILDEAGTIRSVTRNGKTVYKSPNYSESELKAFVSRNHRTKRNKQRSRAFMNNLGITSPARERQEKKEDDRRRYHPFNVLNAKIDPLDGDIYYGERRTDHAARRRRASGR